MPVAIPQGLLAQRALGEDWSRWLDRLPRLTESLLGEWHLEPAAPALHGFCSLVVPVRDADGVPAALKVSFDGDDESRHEGVTLQHWGGHGAVRLLRADPRRRALLAWLPGPDLGDAWDIEACEVVGGLYGRLHVPALPQLATVASYVERWLDDLADLGRDIPVPRRLVEQALATGRGLLGDDLDRPAVVHGDLHYANVMSDGAGEWVAIDPKPMSGDRHYELAPMLWNRMDELSGPGAVGSVRDGLRRRFHALVDAGDLDEARARDWVVVRMTLNASWTVADARRADRLLSAEEQEWITRCMAITKAVQD